MKIGLLFGSFNPLHIGHLAIANYMVEFTDLQQVWLVVSPRNPLKKKSSLMDARRRLVRVKKAIGKHKKIKVSDIEFSFPLIKGGLRSERTLGGVHRTPPGGISATQPSYTINTLELLKKKYPHDEFVLIIGSDNLSAFHKWKDYKKILSGYKIYVYPRSSPLKKGVGGICCSPFIKGGLRGISAGGIFANLAGFRNLSGLNKNIKIVNAPRMDISSTFIRKAIKKGKDMRCFVA